MRLRLVDNRKVTTVKEVRCQVLSANETYGRRLDKAIAHVSCKNGYKLRINSFAIRQYQLQKVKYFIPTLHDISNGKYLVGLTPSRMQIPGFVKISSYAYNRRIVGIVAMLTFFFYHNRLICRGDTYFEMDQVGETIFFGPFERWQGV